MPEAAGPGTANALLNSDGTSRLATPGLAVKLTRTPSRGAAGALATTGPQRHAGAGLAGPGGDPPRRRVKISLPNAPGWAVVMALDLDEHTAGGGGLTRWREPEVDAAGGVDSAPRWRLVAPPTLTRLRAGAGADVEFELEEV